MRCPYQMTEADDTRRRVPADPGRQAAGLAGVCAAMLHREMRQLVADVQPAARDSRINR
ncbi:IclR-ED domain-containing protein [Burkholderia sp. IT-111MI5]